MINKYLDYKIVYVYLYVTKMLYDYRELLINSKIIK